MKKLNYEWFEKQFGKQPKRSRSEIHEAIEKCEMQLKQLRQELRDVEIYWAQKDAAVKSFVYTLYEQGVNEWK